MFRSATSPCKAYLQSMLSEGSVADSGTDGAHGELAALRCWEPKFDRRQRQAYLDSKGMALGQIWAWAGQEDEVAYDAGKVEKDSP